MRGLPESVSQRLKGPGHRAKSTAGRLELVHTGLVGWRAPTGDGAVTVGAPDTALQVLEALAAANTVGGHTAPELATAGVRDAVAETLFGPRRLLSDPASKAALAPFGLPLPQEELCSSPSRAASEAARMGFPVRITLASPDLRVWDQPELTVDGVDNAARVRDVFHQLSSLATEHTAGTRILGVTVTGTRLAEALLSVTARPLTDQTSLVELGFADPHGAASSDGTWLPIPTTAAAVERACTRLAGRSLLLGTTAATRQSTCEDLADLLNRLASLLAAFPAELETVRLHPVALLLGGGFEVREAGVQVTDAFARALESA